MFVSVISATRQLIYNTVQDDCAGLAAEMSYHLLMISAPCLLLLLTLFGFFGGLEQFQSQLLYIYEILPQQVTDIISSIILTIMSGSIKDITIISLLIALWAAVGGGKVVIKALKRVYRLENRQSNSRYKFLKLDLFSLSILSVMSLGMLIGSNLLIAGSWVIDYFSRWFSLPLLFMMYIGHGLIIILFVILLSAFVYRVVPQHSSFSANIKIPWHVSLKGALFFALTWLLLTILFSSYVKFLGHYNEVYGTLGGIIIFMLWLYLSSLAFLVGAELNAMLGCRPKE